MTYPQLGIFVDHTQMVKDTLDYCRTVRKAIPDFDVVVAIPRGGFFMASIISSIIGRPMSTPDGLLRKECWWTSSNKVEHNREYCSSNSIVPITNIENLRVLLVDDISYNILGTLERVRRMLVSKYPKMSVYKTSLYTMDRCKQNLDFYCKRISMDHWMEKDMLIRRRTQPIGWDIDGALCTDPEWRNGMSEAEWVEGLVNATPYLIPHYTIDYIITARQEKYRELTVAWLKKYGVKYDELIMSDGHFHNGHAEYKAKIIKAKLDGGIYVESSLSLAKQIYDLCKVQVICTETSQLIGSVDTAFEYHPAFGILYTPLLQDKLIDNTVSINHKKPKSTWLFG